MTDVRIATELLTDAFLGRLDAAIIVSGDSDLSPPIQAVKLHHPQIQVTVAFPPMRFSSELARIADVTKHIWPRTLEKYQMPDTVTKRDGTVLSRPAQWR